MLTQQQHRPHNTPYSPDGISISADHWLGSCHEGIAVRVVTGPKARVEPSVLRSTQPTRTASGEPDHTSDAVLPALETPYPRTCLHELMPIVPGMLLARTLGNALHNLAAFALLPAHDQPAAFRAGCSRAPLAAQLVAVVLQLMWVRRSLTNRSPGSSRLPGPTFPLVGVGPCIVLSSASDLHAGTEINDSPNFFFVSA